MCELLGMSFNLPVRPSISFTGFRRRGKPNPHGWGLAFYPDESVQVFKEPIQATKSHLFEFLKDYKAIKSKIFIAHVRNSTKGTKSFKNTHPFSRELNAKDYVFAHNGTIDNCSKLKLGKYEPIGETDSEHVFCHILSYIEHKNITEWDKEGFQWLYERLLAINNFGTFNCLFSDGRLLVCYFDTNEHKGFYFVHREPPFNQIRLNDEDWEVNLAEEKDPRQKGFIVATKPLTNESWEKLIPGELIVFKDGRMIYSNFRNVEKSLHSAA